MASIFLKGPIIPNSLSTHISSAVGAILAVLTALDKSISVTSDQRAVIVAILVSLAGALQLAHLGLKAKALDAYTVIRVRAQDFVRYLPAPVQNTVDQIADQVVSDVKQAVDGNPEPTLADIPSTPIS